MTTMLSSPTPLLLISILLSYIPLSSSSLAVTRFIKGKGCGNLVPVRHLDFRFVPPPQQLSGNNYLTGVSCAWVTTYDWQAFTPIDTSCSTSPTITSSTDLSPQFSSSHLNGDDSCERRNDTAGTSNYWMGGNSSSVPPPQIVMDLGCSKLVSNLKVQNSYNNGTSATKDFTLSISPDSVMWSPILVDTLPDQLSNASSSCPQPYYNFAINGVGRYVMFQADTYWGQGPGLKSLWIS